MRSIIASLAVLALAGCQKTATDNSAAAADTNVVSNDVAAANDMMAPAAATINETSWEFVDPKSHKAVTESVDANGNYVLWAGAEHVDHGTVVMKDGKACFTSAMTKDGEECWTDPKIELGASGETVSDKGDKLAIKRVAYVVVPDNVKP